ncbi:MAG: NAD(P)/FAD-dependent oxidoreductase [Spirochaetaceae bacterium]|nr:MAG: NAD(P)/FAD-dependent oxidoreductase [Spirochaetaceae bacterium]
MSNVVIIGGGPAGLEAARQARRAGYTVQLVSATPAGGRATMGSLLPSKVWLHAAGGHGQTNAGAIVSHINATRKEWIAQNSSELAAAGVELVQGRAVLNASNAVDVYEGDEPAPVRTLQGEAIIIAAGSEPTFAPGVKPNGDRIIAPRHTQTLTAIPEHIVFVGGGVTTTEYASAFAALGSRVEICTRGARLLSRGEKEVAEAITHHLETDQGISVHRRTAITKVEQVGDRVHTHTADGRVIESSHAFIATGRAADLSCIDAGGADSASRFRRRSDGGLETDAQGQTSVPTVYAIGDAAGGTFTVAKAVHEAREAVRAVGGETPADAPVAAVTPPTATSPGHVEILEAVYSNPEVAWVGPVDSLPEESTDEYELVRRSYTALLAAHIHGSTAGFVKLWIRRSDDTVVAGAAFGEQAATLCTFIQLACNAGLTVEQISRIPGGHPTIVEIFSA